MRGIARTGLPERAAGAGRPERRNAEPFLVGSLWSDTVAVDACTFDVANNPGVAKTFRRMGAELQQRGAD